MSFALAQWLVAADAPISPTLIQYLPIVFIFVAFYFLLVRPQQRARQQQETMRSKLKKNDRVVTAGGIVGTVVQVTEREVTLKIDDTTRIKILRSSISDMYQPDKQDASAGGVSDAKS